MRSFDVRRTISRAQAREVYDGFARKGHIGGRDASGGYGGPAVQALLSMACFAQSTQGVFEFGCGQGKLADLVLERHPTLRWSSVDQSPEMVALARKNLQRHGEQFRVDLLPSGNPAEDVRTAPTPGSVDRYVSTYVLDLLSEEDMYAVLSDAERRLDKQRGLLLLAGITWGYRDSIKCCLMTLLWELLYRVVPKTVGGCRPQHLVPYLRAKGWTVVETRRTLPTGFPWMVSEVVAARPPGTPVV